MATPMYGCPIGFSLSWELGYRTCLRDKQDQTPPNSCNTNSPSPLIGHPINAATGNKERFETDYESADGVLKVERHYLNQFSGWTQNTLPKLQDLRSTEPSKICLNNGIIKYRAYDPVLDAQRDYIENVCLSYAIDPSSNYRIYITLSNGFIARFRETSTNIFSPNNVLIGKLRALDPATNNNASWEYTAQDNTKQLFDQSGLLIAVVNASGRKINYQYTNFILSRATDDVGRSLTYNYDTNGNVSSITLPDSNSIVYTYQDTPVKNTLSKVTFPDGSFKSFFYNEATYIDPATPFAMRALTHQTDELGNTLGAYHYDSAGKAISTETALGLDKFSLVGTYAYNALGQRISKVAGTTKEFYHYDEAGQLIAVADATGKATREYIYNGNQLVSFVTVAYPSIPSISLTSAKATFQGSAALEKIQTGYTGTVGYVHFSGEGQASWPLAITTSGNYTSTLRYSLTGTDRPLALLIDGVQKATVNFPATANLNTWGSVRATVTLALTAGNHTLTLKTTGSGGPNIDTIGIGAASGQTAAPVGTLYYVHNDHQGTPQVATNQAKAVVWMADYQPFGKLQPGQTNSIELYSRFPGQYIDTETGLYYNYFRDYDPSIGRYIESDPIGLGGGINTYAYVEGNPIKYIDSSGKIAQAAGGVVNSIVLPAMVGGGLWALYCSQNPDNASCKASKDLAKRCIDWMSNDDADDNNCEALYQSTLQTCASLTGKKKFACFEAARINREQCYQEKK